MLSLTAFYSSFVIKKHLKRNKRNKNREIKDLYIYCLNLFFNICFIGIDRQNKENNKKTERLRII